MMWVNLDEWANFLGLVLSCFLFICMLCYFCNGLKQAHEEEGQREASEQMKLEPPMIQETHNE